MLTAITPDARGVQRLPLAARAQHVEDTVGTGTVGNPGRPPPNRWVFTRLGIRGSRTSHSSSAIWKEPVVGLAAVDGPTRFGRPGLESFAFVIAQV